MKIFYLNIRIFTFLIVLFFTHWCYADSFPLWFSTKEPNCAIGISPALNDSLISKELSVLLAHISIALSKEEYNHGISIKENEMKNTHQGFVTTILKDITLYVPKLISIEKDTLLANGANISLIRYGDDILRDTIYCSYFATNENVNSETLVEINYGKSHLKIIFTGDEIESSYNSITNSKIENKAQFITNNCSKEHYFNTNNAFYCIVYDLLHKIAFDGVIKSQGMTMRDAATKDGMEIGRTKSNGNVRININYLIDNDNCCEIKVKL